MEHILKKAIYICLFAAVSGWECILCFYVRFHYDIPELFQRFSRNMPGSTFDMKNKSKLKCVQLSVQPFSVRIYEEEIEVLPDL